MRSTFAVGRVRRGDRRVLWLTPADPRVFPGPWSVRAVITGGPLVPGAGLRNLDGHGERPATASGDRPRASDEPILSSAAAEARPSGSAAGGLAAAGTSGPGEPTTGSPPSGGQLPLF